MRHTLCFCGIGFYTAFDVSVLALATTAFKITLFIAVYVLAAGGAAAKPTRKKKDETCSFFYFPYFGHSKKKEKSKIIYSSKLVNEVSNIGILFQ